MKVQDGIYLRQVNNGNTKTKCEMCSKLTIKTPEQSQWSRFGVFIEDYSIAYGIN